jgi:hypothetical protein
MWIHNQENHFFGFFFIDVLIKLIRTLSDSSYQLAWYATTRIRAVWGVCVSDCVWMYGDVTFLCLCMGWPIYTRCWTCVGSCRGVCTHFPLYGHVCRCMYAGRTSGRVGAWVVRAGPVRTALPRAGSFVILTSVSPYGDVGMVMVVYTWVCVCPGSCVRIRPRARRMHARAYSTACMVGEGV